MSKQILENASRAGQSSYFQINPSDYPIVGVDLPADVQSPANMPKHRMERDEGLVLSLIQNGNVQNSTIWIDSTKDDAKPVFLTGKRRALHGRWANDLRKKQGIDPIIFTVKTVKCSPAEARKIVMAENSHRVNDTYSHTGLMIVQSIEIDKLSPKEAYVAAGVSGSHGHRLRALMSLQDECIKAIDEKKVPLVCVDELKKIEDPERQVARLRELIEENAKVLSLTEEDFVDEDPYSDGESEGEGDGEGQESEPKAEKEAKISIALVRKVLDMVDEGKRPHELTEEFVLALRWVAGQVATNRVKGLTAACKAASIKKPAEKRGRKPKAK